MRKNIFFKNNKNGFTLVEALISSFLTISVMTLVTSFLFRFNGFSNRAVIQNTLDADLRIVQSRLEKEITPGNRVLSSCNTTTQCIGYPGGATIYTDSNRLIYTVPIGSTGNNDIIVLEYADEADYNDSGTVSNTSSGKINRLKISVFPGTGSTRVPIRRQSLDAFINTTNDNNQSYKIFRYFTKNTPTANAPVTVTEVVPAAATPPITTSDAGNISVVVVNMWSKKWTNSNYMYVNKTSQFKFINK